MIRSFRHRGLKRHYDREDRSGISASLLDRVEDVLALLDVATAPQDLILPGFRLHPLKGNLRGYWSITLSGNWRIVFTLSKGDVYDADLVDYH